MTAPAGLRVLGALLVLVGVAACARGRPEAPVPPEIVALAPDPETGAVGALTVGTPEGDVTLDAANESTTLAPGRAPAPPVVLSPEAVQRLFGDALAALPPPARRFLLYFDTGDDTLTPESKALVPEILATVQSRAVPDVSIVGHTDTTGAAAANVELGLRRAALIRDLLVSAGLDARLIEVASHGETNPVVPTPDNTPEARNRRVEVTVR